MKCHYCERDISVPCRNSLDMEDNICELDDEICYQALKAAGGGERGLVYIDRARQMFRDVENATQQRTAK